tara:strand:+ start:11078 stop:11503 length:426 start_codon:yes stop_codon:yes gene_type:complete
MSKKEDMIADEADIQGVDVLTQLTELTVLLTNALGYEPADAQKNEKAGKQVNVERLAAKPITKEQTMVKRNHESKLMPENMTYKAEPDQEEIRIESDGNAEDSQDKDVEAALETALGKLKRLRHTLTINEDAALTPSDEMV